MAEQMEKTTGVETTSVAEVPQFEEVALTDLPTDTVETGGSRKGAKALVIGGIGLAVGGVCYLIHKRRKAKKAAVEAEYEDEYEDEEFEDDFLEEDVVAEADAKEVSEETEPEAQPKKGSRKTSTKKEEKDA